MTTSSWARTRKSRVLSSYISRGIDIPVVTGSGLLALEAVTNNPKVQKGKMSGLLDLQVMMDAVDS